MTTSDDLLNKLAFNGYHIIARRGYTHHSTGVNLDCSTTEKFYENFAFDRVGIFPTAEELGRLMMQEGFYHIEIKDNDGLLLFRQKRSLSDEDYIYK